MHIQKATIPQTRPEKQMKGLTDKNPEHRHSEMIATSSWIQSTNRIWKYKNEFKDRDKKSAA